MVRVTLSASFLACLMLLSSSAQAQFDALLAAGSGHAVSASGSAVVKKPAERMRLSINLIARDADLQKAGAALNQRIASAKADLTALGAIPDSIKVGLPKIQVAETDAHQQMRQMMMQRLGRGNAAAAKKDSAEVITLTASLVAEWKLEDGDPIERLAKVHGLQKTIREAKLSGADANPELSPEEAELLEEAQMLSGMDSDAPKPGEPVFLFLAEISPQERSSALKEAFSHALNQANELAATAGVRRGRLLSLSETSRGGITDVSDYTYGFSYNSPLYRAYQMANRHSEDLNNGQATAIGLEPGELQYAVTVVAAFEIGGP